MEHGAREIIGSKRKKEQGVKGDEKGAVTIGKKERALKNGREQGEPGKMTKGAGSIDPPNHAKGPRQKFNVSEKRQLNAFLSRAPPPPKKATHRSVENRLK